MFFNSILVIIIIQKQENCYDLKSSLRQKGEFLFGYAIVFVERKPFTKMSGIWFQIVNLVILIINSNFII